MTIAARYAQNKWSTFPIHNGWGDWGSQYTYLQGIPKVEQPSVKPNKTEECVINVKFKGNIKVIINVEAL